jgi:hypothetical protein
MYRLLIGLARPPCFGGVVVTSHHLAVAPQTSAKYELYCTVYYTILNSSCEAQRVPKNLKQIAEDRVKSQK